MQDFVGALNLLAGTTGLGAAGAGNAAITEFLGYPTSVAVYGATGDGSTDDRPAIQAAIDAVVAAGGGTVYFPKGIYRVGGRLEVAGSNVRLLGSPGAKIKLGDAANSCVVVVGKDPHPAAADVLTDCVVEALEIDGNIANQTARGAEPFEYDYDNCGILAVGTDRFVVKDCYVHDTWATGLSVQRSRASRLIDTYLSNVGMDLTLANAGRNGISIFGPFPDTDPSDESSRRHIVSGVTIHLFRDNGISVNSQGNNATVVTGCSVEGRTTFAAHPASNWGIVIELQPLDTVDGGKSVIAGNVIRNCDTGIITNGYSGSQGKAVAITGNTVIDSHGAAIYLQSTGVACVGNTVHRHGLGYPGRPAADSGVAPGIVVVAAPTAGSSEIVVSGNSVFTTVDQPGIQCSQEPVSLDSVVIANNVLRGFSIGQPIPDTGIPAGPNGQGIRVRNCLRALVTGNTVRKYRTGITVQGSRASVTGNMVFENDQAGIRIESVTTGTVVSHNQCVNNGKRTDSGARAGIYVAGQSANLVIEGNTCTDDQGTKTQEFALKADGGCSGLISGGRVDGNATSTYSLTATDRFFLGTQPLGHPGVVSKSAAYTATFLDSVILADATSAGFTISLPSAAGANGRRLSAKKVDVGPNAVKLDPNGSETIDGAVDLDLTALAPKATLVSDGTNWRTI